MNRDRLFLLLWCGASGIFAYVLLQLYSVHNAPLWKKFERQWAADVKTIESSEKVRPLWTDVREIEVIGGTPETKAWLRRVHVPVAIKPNGRNRMEVLVVVWEENGKRGVLIQYNIEDGTTKNTLLELSRTLILSSPTAKSGWQTLLDELKQ